MPDPFTLLLDAWVFAVGAVIGSFSNVCIHRLPRGESVVFPGSRCPACGAAIAPYDNVPILAWLLLRGRCRKCRAPISARYPLVELLLALLFLASFLRFGPTISAAVGATLSTAAVILVFTDWECRTLPEEVTLGVLLAGLAFAIARDVASKVPFQLSTSHVAESLAGALFGAAILQAVRLGYQYIRGEEGMGFGDVEMIGMIGALLGPSGVLVSLFFASFAGTLVGGLAGVVRRLAFRRALGLAPEEAARRRGVLVDADDVVLVAGPRWTEVPGASDVGAAARRMPGAAFPLSAFLRLSRRRAARALTTEYGRIFLDDGEDFFRVLAARAEPLPGGRLLVLLSRTDIPFGVFLAVGSLAAFYGGRPVLLWLIGWMPRVLTNLLP